MSQGAISLTQREQRKLWYQGHFYEVKKITWGNILINRSMSGGKQRDLGFNPKPLRDE